MQSHPTRLMILVAGPYRSGTGDDPAKLAANVAAMEAFAMPLFRAGHVPLVGEWLGLPLATLAGSVRIGGEGFCLDGGRRRPQLKRDPLCGATEGRIVTDDTPFDELRQIVERQRAYAPIREGGTKPQKELGVLQDLLESMRDAGVERY